MRQTPDDAAVDGSVAALAAQWADDLASWAIPDDILAQAPESPWIHPVAMFTVGDAVPDSVSHQVARDGLPARGSVLDVGCGGGRASMALVPPAASLVGVDHEEAMLTAFRSAAARRQVQVRTVRGTWPAVADRIPACDVVVCHHVVYNVPAIVPFLSALNAHARRRVVLELPARHPLAAMNPLWRRFWDLDRPTRPDADDLAAIVGEMGFAVHREDWTDPSWGERIELPREDRVRYARVRLCLTDDRDAEVAAALMAESDAAPREVSTIWWDVES